MDHIQVIKDFYGRNRYTLTPYLLDKKTKFALICPGGGYGMVCSFAEGKPYAEKLNQLGSSAFVLKYRVSKKGRYPAPLEEVARALKYILDNSDALNIEKDGYSIWGSSAGGHLAASFSTEDMGYKKYSLPRPDALILSYPVVTMGELTHSGSAKNLLGKNPTPELLKETSVEQHITPQYPPTYLWCGKDDKVVNPQNSVMLDEKLSECGVPHMFHLFDSAEHGCGVAAGLPAEAWFKEAVDFWAQNTYSLQGKA
jgi:acetyl esterase/lipase